jgi:threonine dehydratase
MLARLLEHVAETGANVMEVYHRRAMWLAPFAKPASKCCLEVRD